MSDTSDAPPGDDSERIEGRARLHEQLSGQPAAARELGRYRLLDLLGRSGLGTVWRAHDRELGREVALELLHEDALNWPRQTRQQLFAEAARMVRLNHPNVVRIYDLGEHEGELFVARELVVGTTLRAWQQQRRRSWRELLEVYLAAGAGLAAAHAAGLVHGDFKPDNVLIGDDGRVLVTDFAVTRHVLEARLELELAAMHADSAIDSPADSRSSSKVGANSLQPPSAYMALEQFEGRHADAKSDQFAFCAALWEALCGERPFQGRTWTQLREAIVRGPMPTGRRVGPRGLWMVLERGLAALPDARWPSLELLLARLRRARERRRRWGLVAAAFGLSGMGFAAAIPTLLHEDETHVVADAALLELGPGEGQLELESEATTRLDTEIVVGKGLAREAVVAVARGEEQAIQRCIDDGLAAEPRLSGVVEVGFVIDGQGKVASAKAALSAPAELQRAGGPVAACIVKRVKTWRFAGPESGMDVECVYAVVLEPASPEG